MHKTMQPVTGAKYCFDVRKVEQVGEKRYNFGDFEYWECSSKCTASKLSQFDNFLITIGLKEESNDSYDEHRECVNSCNERYFAKFVSPPSKLSRFILFLKSLNIYMASNTVAVHHHPMCVSPVPMPPGSLRL